MVWCLSLAILSLIISQGADGELDSLGSRTPCWPWRRGGPPGVLCAQVRGGEEQLRFCQRHRFLQPHHQGPGNPPRQRGYLPSQPWFWVPAGSSCHPPARPARPAGRGKPEVVSVVGRAGESAVLGCDLLPPAGRPPLHVIEWLRFGFLLPIFIQFGLYSPRIDPDYVGKTCPQLRGWEVSPTKVGWVEWEQGLFLTALSLPQPHLQLHCLNSA